MVSSKSGPTKLWVAFLHKNMSSIYLGVEPLTLFINLILVYSTGIVPLFLKNANSNLKFILRAAH